MIQLMTKLDHLFDLANDQTGHVHYQIGPVNDQFGTNLGNTLF